jgi:twitching motility protein PilT
VEQPNGLILVTGPTGCGKSTTLAAMIERINQQRRCHIVCIEDPIEYMHSHGLSVIEQREIGTDTGSFPEALRRVFRQSPDVVMIGEMRDLETIHAALTLAETGHLTMGTLHTSSAAHAVIRIIDVFPPGQQTQVRVQLAATLLAVVAQQLLPRASGSGSCVAAEVLVATPAARTLIRENNTHQLYSLMQTGRSCGMKTLNQSLVELVQQKKVSMETAIRRSPNATEFERLLYREPVGEPV